MPSRGRSDHSLIWRECGWCLTPTSDFSAFPRDIEAQDDRRLDRIRAEVDRGFDALWDVEDGVSVFGSARVEEEHRWYGLCRRRRAAWPSRASP